jgi:glycyl-tRNA synthetase
MPMPNEKSDSQLMEKIVSLCKRRGFIFQSSEIYGGLNGLWDYGPLGVELKRNLKDYWWRVMVHERDDVVGMDGSVLMNRAVWKASGHEDTFTDPMVDCLLTKARFRADQIPEQSGHVIHFYGAEDQSLVDALVASVTQRTDAGRHRAEQEMLEKFRTAEEVEKRRAELEDLRHSSHPEIRRFAESEIEKIEAAERREDHFAVLLKPAVPRDKAHAMAKQFFRARGIESPRILAIREEDVLNSRSFNPDNGALLTPPRSFHLMFKTYVGATEDESSITYLRPETAQAIFVQFKNVLEVSRKKLPFGIAQIGKAFRNEINPRNFTFRSREFEQMELEYFCRAEQGMALLEYWKEERLKFYENIGIPRSKLHVKTVPDEERAFYSKGTYDVEYDFPFGRQELEGVAYRTDYDLRQHQAASGKSLEYFDEETKQRFIPHVVEPSAGVDRTVLALICEAYAEDQAPDEKGKMETRTVLRFHPRIAPIKCAVFPLLKNKEQLVAKAKEVVGLLRPHMTVFYDEGGAIGRRYRRQDEIGTPFALTIDFETLGEKAADLRDTVTLRDRDSMKQERVKISELLEILLQRVR